jgi:RNA recognition motif-containing protein
MKQDTGRPTQYDLRPIVLRLSLCQYCSLPLEDEMPVTVLVDGLPHHFRKEQLQALSGEFGVVTEAFVATRRSGQSLGFGYVLFSSMAEAQQAARTLTGIVIMGKPLMSTSASPLIHRPAPANSDRPSWPPA